MNEQIIAKGMLLLSTSFATYELITYTQSGWKGVSIYPDMTRQFKVENSPVMNPIEFAKFIQDKAKLDSIQPTLNTTINGEAVTLRINRFNQDNILFNMTIRHKISNNMAFEGNTAPLNKAVPTYNTNTGEIETKAPSMSIANFQLEEPIEA
jgi:hypothetical protein